MLRGSAQDHIDLGQGGPFPVGDPYPSAAIRGGRRDLLGDPDQPSPDMVRLVVGQPGEQRQDAAELVHPDPAQPVLRFGVDGLDSGLLLDQFQSGGSQQAGRRPVRNGTGGAPQGQDFADHSQKAGIARRPHDVRRSHPGPRNGVDVTLLGHGRHSRPSDRCRDDVEPLSTRPLRHPGYSQCAPSQWLGA